MNSHTPSRIAQSPLQLPDDFKCWSEQPVPKKLWKFAHLPNKRHLSCVLEHESHERRKNKPKKGEGSRKISRYKWKEGFRRK